MEIKNMLMIIMHNKRDYLESLDTILRRENINDTTLIEKKGVGTALLGDRDSAIMHRGSLTSEYHFALLAVVRDNEKAKHLLDIIDNDATLATLNFEEKGYLCTVPFQQIKSLELESSSVKRGTLTRKIGEYLTPGNG